MTNDEQNALWEALAPRIEELIRTQLTELNEIVDLVSDAVARIEIRLDEGGIESSAEE